MKDRDEVYCFYEYRVAQDLGLPYCSEAQTVKEYSELKKEKQFNRLTCATNRSPQSANSPRDPGLWQGQLI
jgi:hypothetical protein